MCHVGVRSGSYTCLIFTAPGRACLKVGNVGGGPQERGFPRICDKRVAGKRDGIGLDVGVGVGVGFVVSLRLSRWCERGGGG